MSSATWARSERACSALRVSGPEWRRRRPGARRRDERDSANLEGHDGRPADRHARNRTSSPTSMTRPFARQLTRVVTNPSPPDRLRRQRTDTSTQPLNQSLVTCMEDQYSFGRKPRPGGRDRVQSRDGTAVRRVQGERSRHREIPGAYRTRESSTGCSAPAGKSST